MKKPGNKGFLLIEAVLTAAVLAVGVTALFRAFSAGLRSTRESRERLQASFLLEGRAWEIERFGAEAAVPPADDPLLGPLAWTVTSTAEEERTRRDIRLEWGPESRKNYLTLSSYSESP
jgi:hypothetical protein